MAFHTYDLNDADYNCGDLHAWRSEKWTPGVGTCGSGNLYNCQMMALHQGRDFVLQTRHLGYAEISAESGGKSASDLERFTGWKNSPGHNDIMLSNDYNIFGCFNSPRYKHSHCIFQKLKGSEYASCTKYL
jgi:hypothetical protein